MFGWDEHGIQVLADPNSHLLSKLLDFVKLHSEKTEVFRAGCDGPASLIFKSVRAVGALSYSGTHPAQKASFLGFDFDERIVRLRQSTFGRYRRRLNEATTATASSKGGRHASKKRVSTLYQYYSPLGIRGRRPCPSNGTGSSAFYRYGNYLSYVARAQ